MKRYFKNIVLDAVEVKHLPIFEAIEVELGKKTKDPFYPLDEGDQIQTITTRLISLACEINDLLDSICGIRQLAMTKAGNVNEYDYSISFKSERFKTTFKVYSKAGYVTQVSHG